MFYEQGQLTQAQMTDTQLPWWADVISDIPGIPTITAFNANRTANTILYGARGGGGRVGQVRGMFSQNWNPANMFRYSTDEFITNPGTTRSYTPYGAARIGNLIANRFSKAEPVVSLDDMPAPRGTGIPEPTRGTSPIDSTWKAPDARSQLNPSPKRGTVPMTHFEEGFLGRITASSKLNNMSAAQWARGDFAGGLGSIADQKVASRALLMGARGRVTGRIAGFITGSMNFAETGRVWDTTTRSAAKAMRAAGTPMSESVEAGMKMAARLAMRANPIGGAGTVMPKGTGIYSQMYRASGGVATQGSGTAARAAKLALNSTNVAAKLAGKLSPFAPVIVAYDVGKLSSKAVGYGARLLVDMNKSRYSGFRTEIGGNRFVETEASLTSRSRGVQAIQNSRLNARSVLGSEAGSMATYFG